MRPRIPHVALGLGCGGSSPRFRNASSNLGGARSDCVLFRSGVSDGRREEPFHGELLPQHVRLRLELYDIASPQKPRSSNGRGMNHRIWTHHCPAGKSYGEARDSRGHGD